MATPNLPTTNRKVTPATHKPLESSSGSAQSFHSSLVIGAVGESNRHGNSKSSD